MELKLWDEMSRHFLEDFFFFFKYVFTFLFAGFIFLAEKGLPIFIDSAKISCVLR